MSGTSGEGVVVAGAGLAGLFTALRLAPVPVTVLSPVALGEGASSAWAQGGVAAALAEGDSPALHAADTVAAGAGLVDAEVAAAVAAEAPARIADLLALGTPFDRDAAGRLVQSREAAHSAHRVVRVKGDTAGAAIMASLVAAVRACPTIRVVEGVEAIALLRRGGRVAGLLARRAGPGAAEPLRFPAAAVVLATGGIGGLYAVSSNPHGVAGQGLGLAARAGAAIRDPEFVQFHPTGLGVPASPVPLASEALRGEGAVLIDETGTRFLLAAHPAAELAPRDVVARALAAHIAAGHRVFLDTRAAIGAEIDRAFPTIARAARAAGIDPVRDPIPVQPIQHYHMGGVETDGRARASLPGLWVVGETACTGLHGANRLASNSLLEALVFGARAAEDIAGLDSLAAPRGARAEGRPGTAPAPAALVGRLRAAMTGGVGLARDAAGLTAALAEIAAVEAQAHGSAALANMTAAATLVAAAALARRESRGAHQRLDFPATDPAPAQPTRTVLAQALAARAQSAAELAA